MKKITLVIMLWLLSWGGFAQLPLEGFENAWTGSPATPPGGWVVHNEIGTKTWVQSIAGSPAQVPYEGNHVAYLDSENVLPSAPIPSNWLITPQFNVPVNGLLHFYSKLTKTGDQGGIYKIMIAPVTDPSIPAADLPFTELVPTLTEFQLNPSQLEYAEKTFAIPAAYTGTQVRIAFIMQGDDKDRWLIDNVEVVALCNPPSALSANNTTLTTAELNWANPTGVTQWEIEVVDEFLAPTGVGVVYSGSLPYLKTGLTANGDYKYYVRSLCSDGGKSAWIGPFYFKTPTIGERCSDPLVIPATLPYSNMNNTVNFGDYYEGIPGTGCNASGNYLAGNDVVYSYTPTASGTIHLTLSNTDGAAGMFVYNDCAAIGINCIAGVLSSAATPGIISTLAVTAGTTYYIVISTNNIPLLTTNYMLSVQQVNCAAPTALAVSGQTSNSANLSWAAGTASSWEIAVQTPASGVPTGAGQTVTQNTNVNVTQTLAGAAFTPATNYEYYVRANCGNGTFSIWAGPFAFATTQVPAILPFNESFDGPQQHGFSITNGTQANKWYVGSSAFLSPSNALYISNDFGIHNYYTTNTTSVTHVYKDITIPVGTTTLGVSFDLKVGGDANDYVRVWLAPTSFIPTPGTQLTAANGSQIGGNYTLSPEWSAQSGALNVAALAGQTRRLVFEWRNDAIGGVQTAAAIDNILVKAVSCPQPTAVTASNVTDTQATFSWTAPAGVTPTSYDYYYSAATPPTATTPETGSVNGTTVTLSPLNTTSVYSFLGKKQLWQRKKLLDRAFYLQYCPGSRHTGLHSEF